MALQKSCRYLHHFLQAAMIKNIQAPWLVLHQMCHSLGSPCLSLSILLVSWKWGQGLPEERRGYRNDRQLLHPPFSSPLPGGRRQAFFLSAVIEASWGGLELRWIRSCYSEACFILAGFISNPLFLAWHPDVRHTHTHTFCCSIPAGNWAPLFILSSSPMPAGEQLWTPCLLVSL